MALSDETEDFLRRHASGEQADPARYSEPAASTAPAAEAEPEPEPPRTFSDRIGAALEAAGWLMIVVGATNALRILAGGPWVEASGLGWQEVIMNFFSAGMCFFSARGNSMLTMNQNQNKT